LLFGVAEQFGSSRNFGNPSLLAPPSVDRLLGQDEIMHLAVVCIVEPVNAKLLR
jgi:hypothetical protein